MKGGGDDDRAGDVYRRPGSVTATLERAAR
jgi:hypothetical protein